MSFNVNFSDLCSRIINYYEDLSSSTDEPDAEAPSTAPHLPTDSLVTEVFNKLDQTSYNALQENERGALRHLYTDISNTPCHEHPDWIEPLLKYRELIPAFENTTGRMEEDTSPERASYAAATQEPITESRLTALLRESNLALEGARKQEAYDRISAFLEIARNPPTEVVDSKRRKLSPQLDLSNLELTKLPKCLFTDPIFEGANLSNNPLEEFPTDLTLGSIQNIHNYQQTRVEIKRAEDTFHQALDREDFFTPIQGLLDFTGHISTNPTLTGKAKTEDILQRIQALIDSSEDTGPVEICANFLSDMQRRFPNMVNLLEKYELNDFTRPIIQLSAEELKTSGDGYLTHYIHFKSQARGEPPLLNISIPRLCSRPPLCITENTEMAETILTRILHSIKHNTPPNWDDLNENPTAIHLLFKMIDELDFKGFQMQYLEPFQSKFPTIPLSQAPGTIMSLNLNSTNPDWNMEAFNEMPTENKANIRELNASNMNITNLNLAGCTNLRKLKFERCYGGSIASILAALPPEAKASIEEIDLSTLGITGLDLSEFTGLKKLILSEPRGGGVVDVLNTLTPETKARIAALDLSGANIEGIDLKGFTGLKKWASRFYYTDLVLSTLAALPPQIKANIEELDLSSHDLTNLNLSAFTGLKKLMFPKEPGDTPGGIVAALNTLAPAVKAKIKELDISDTDITGLDLSGFSGLEQLNTTSAKGPVGTVLNTLHAQAKARIEELNLSKTNITHLDLSGFSHLKKLNVGIAKGPVRTVLNTLPEESKPILEELNLSGADITDLNLSAFTGLKKLTTRGVGTTAVALLNTLSSATKQNLEELDLEACDIAGLDLSEFSRLKKMHVRSCGGPLGTVLNTLHPASKARIKELDVSDTYNRANLAPVDITNLNLTPFTGLKTIGIQHAKGTVGVVLNTLHPAVKARIKELHLHGCDITNLDLRLFTKLQDIDTYSAKGPVGLVFNTLPPELKEKMEELKFEFVNIEGLDLKPFTALKRLITYYTDGVIINVHPQVETTKRRLNRIYFLENPD